MKYFSLTLLLFLFSLLAFTQNDGSLDGTWKPVKQELGGDAFPKETFKDQKLVITGDQYVYHAETADKGKLTYNAGKITIEGTEGPNKGKTIPAIYKIEDGVLAICYNLGGTDEAPKSFDTKGQSMYFLAVFLKE